MAIPLDKWYDLEDLILANNLKFQKELSEAEKEMKKGECVSYEELRKKLGLK